MPRRSLSAPTAAFGRDGCGSEAEAEARRTQSAEPCLRGACRPEGETPGGREQPRGGRARAASPGLAPRWDPAVLEEIITVISVTAITAPARAGAAPSGARKRRGAGGGSGPAGCCGLSAAAAAPCITVEDPLHLPPGCLRRRRSVCRGVASTGEERKAAAGLGKRGSTPPPTPQTPVRRVEARGELADPGPAGSGPPPCGAGGPRPRHGDAPRAALSLPAPRLRERRGTRRPHRAASRTDGS
ncbi:uncharacterized protein LOC110401883 isoform X2 [Numida meleagris]|uniref:uncharacterized protein LOC110401883 isoform X2 n=1 Tax=Numida meleagris TaxID=8996 RepID=UPI000B3DFA8A|nr:uncharacterized protein LOC110401883 isoform X2 [Numida meleagris]